MPKQPAGPATINKERTSTEYVDLNTEAPVDLRSLQNGGLQSALGDQQAMDQQIETVAASGDFDDLLALEAFMEDELDITLPVANDPSDLGYVEVRVNGKLQFIFKGKRQRVKRKYVEVLARLKTTSYTQQSINPMEPDAIQMVPKTVFVHPFNVVYDPRGDRGVAWLEKVMAERG